MTELEKVEKSEMFLFNSIRFHNAHYAPLVLVLSSLDLEAEEMRWV